LTEKVNEVILISY